MGVRGSTRKPRNICDPRNSFLVARGSGRGVRIVLDLGEGGQVGGDSPPGDKVASEFSSRAEVPGFYTGLMVFTGV